MFKFFTNLLDTNLKELKKLEPLVAKINSLEEGLEKLSPEDFPAQTAAFKNRLANGETLDDLLPEAFALVREAIKRVVHQRAFDVQLLAAIALHQGKVAEQKTGEGKTLASSVAAYLNALSGRGVHMVTVNDYLARRDSGWYGQALAFLGLQIGCIIHEQSFVLDFDYQEPGQIDPRLRHLRPVTRRDAYLADITYGTNNEFGFDYLRDNMRRSRQDQAQRGFAYAIVDEVDSILIDEARTPLIISAPDTEPTDKYYQAARLIQELSSDTDYTIDEKFKNASLTEHGILKVEKKLNIDNLYEKDFETLHHLENALKAKTLYLKNRDYVVKDGQVIIVDEFTGRLMHGRRWSDGLHQSVEAKENVQIQRESKTLATISLQNYFRMYEKLSGMTGTAVTEAEEFEKIYNLPVLMVPTNLPNIRQDADDVVYKTSRAKFAAIVAEIAVKHQQGQPVLVGTTSIEKNEILHKFLTKKGIPHQVLNAKNHEKEAKIIAKAGSPGMVTVATNMAGRGVDIVLGGDRPEEADPKQAADWQKEHEKVLAFGGLHVIGTERHESRRIDNQLRGRAGRQGDPGSSRFYVALDDDIMRLFGGEKIARLMTIFNVPENQPLEHAMVSRAIEQAQNKVESFNFDMRKRVVEYDDVMNRQREIIYTRRNKVLDLENQAGDDSLKQDLLQKADEEITNLLSMYSPEGFIKLEADKITSGFCEILPLSEPSQKELKEFLQKQKDPAKISKFFTSSLESAYQAREKEHGPKAIRELERLLTLEAIDRLWINHLSAMDNLREGIGLRGYAQKDPIVEYKREAYNAFQVLLNSINTEVLGKIFRVGLVAPRARSLFAQAVERRLDPRAFLGQSGAAPPADNQPAPKAVVSGQAKLGRNDPCWCGSGKKFKKCHYPQES